MNARLTMLDLDILGFIDHNITVNIIKDEKIVAEKDLTSSETDRKCDQLQKSALYHFYRAGTGSGICSDRSGKRGLPLQILRREISAGKRK